MSSTGLYQVAAVKADEYAGRSDVVAVAITGSVARGTSWHGSDVDLWAFTASDPAGDDFFDGVVGDTYWEIDLKPIDWLTASTPDDWLTPPALHDDDGVTPVEALWGCIVHTDRDGTLTRVSDQVRARMADRAWLMRRASHYVHYGLGALDAQHDVAPLQAIFNARVIADKYAVAAHWMTQGVLLSSIMRMPERLADWPEIHALYRLIWDLDGETGAYAFVAAYESLPAALRKPWDRDFELEVKPALKHGLYDGAVHYLRDHMSEHPDEFAPLLGLSDDLDLHKATVAAQVRELLLLVRANVT